MAPCGVGANQNDEVRLADILIVVRHCIAAERAFVPRHGRSHAQARIRIDIGAADVAFHELVGDVIVFREELTRDVERHRIRATFINEPGENRRDFRQGFVPAGAPSANLRVQQPAVQVERFSERGSLGAQPTEVCGVQFVTRNPEAVCGSADGHPASHAAVRAGGSCHGCVHGESAVGLSGAFPGEGRVRVGASTYTRPLVT